MRKSRKNNYHESYTAKLISRIASPILKWLVLNLTTFFSWSNSAGYIPDFECHLPLYLCTSSAPLGMLGQVYNIAVAKLPQPILT